MERVFFDKNDTLERILFLYGHSDDCFYFNGVMYNNLEYMLEKHLLRLGYDLVLFYNGVQKLYCYTQEMANKRDKLLGALEVSQVSISKQIDDDFDDIFGISDISETTNEQEENVPLRLQIDDLQIATFADDLMRRDDIKTAIVFIDGWDLIENTEEAARRTLCNRMRSWYHLGAENQNIAILCFSTLTLPRLERALSNWAFLQDKIIQGNAFTNAVKYISIPGEDELEGRLWLEKSYRDCSHSERERIKAGAKCSLHNMGNMLKGLDHFLKTTPDAVLTLQNSLDDDEDALNTLKATKGWEQVVETVERIARTIQASNLPEKRRKKYDYIGRMSEESSFIPSGICCNIVLEGNPGTGKTTIAKLLGRIFRKLKLLPSGHVVEVARDDLVGRYIGHTAANTRAKIEEAMGGILFIDEAYSLFREGNAGGGSRDFGIEAIDTLIEAMTRSVGSFAVVLAGYPEEMEYMLNANPGFRSRFGQNIVTIEDYEPDLLQSISLEYLASKYGHTQVEIDPGLLKPGITGSIPLNVFFKGWFEARNRKQFGNARDCQNLIDVLVDHAISRNSKLISIEDFPKKLRDYFKEADLDLSTVMASIETEIVGQNAVKEKLYSIVKRLRLYNRQAIIKPEKERSSVAPGHYLFCGNPGTGKSTIADKFAQVLGALRIIGRFVPKRITGAELIHAMQSDGIHGMRQLIEDSRGGVLFIDEAHQLTSIPMALQLLLDPMIEYKNELCIILACYEDEVDSLFDHEPGLQSRLTGEFHFADYSASELLEIFKIKVKKSGYMLDEKAEQAALKWFEKVLQKGEKSHNGRYAEHLIDIAEAQMAERVDSKSDDDFDEKELFTILPDDIPIQIDD